MMSPSQRNRDTGKRRQSRADYAALTLAANIIDVYAENGVPVTVCRTAYAWGVDTQRIRESNKQSDTTWVI